MAASVALAALWLPQKLDHPGLHAAALSIGLLGTWRYSWWLTHLVRALIYQYRFYPALRARADQAWKSGARPKRLHFMMTTFREDPGITRDVLYSIVQQCRECGCPATLFIGTGHPDDEAVIRSCFDDLDEAVDLQVTVVRQHYPGKRMAIGLVLRAMSREGIDGDEPVVFLDGDTILGPGCVSKCISILAADAGVDALTTDERAIVRGPAWQQHWLDMRFAQRHLTMQSHALSRKVLTLTGRMSVFRARTVVQEEFISTIENDYLDHWLWGRFRFLSGDDKSSWYVLLRKGATMLYVPDAITYTIERVEGNGVERMRANLLRWSGNMLRNGARALALGPRRVGFFIWWCVLDQRIATWSTLVGPIAALGAAVYSTPWALVAYLAWVLAVRMTASFVLFSYARNIDATFPFLLYVSQVLNAATKAYIWFRLPMQRWSNRGDQRAAFGTGTGARVRLLVANGLSYLCVLLLAAFALAYTLRAFDA
jgi:glycosyltransferase Alg8